MMQRCNNRWATCANATHTMRTGTDKITARLAQLQQRQDQIAAYIQTIAHVRLSFCFCDKKNKEG